MEWHNSYGGAGPELCFALIQASDGGYVLAGSTESFGIGCIDIYVVKTNEFGVVPESLTIGVMLLLSTIAVAVSARYFRKRRKWENW